MTKVIRMVYEDGMRYGIEEGAKAETEKTVTNMLRENFDLSVIQRITGLTIEEINQISAAISQSQ